MKKIKVSNFCSRVYKLTKQIPKGKITTYKALAQALNSKAYRQVGQCLAKNPYAPKVPCHRVVKSDGSIAGFQGSIRNKAINKKISLLTQEGIKITKKKIINFHPFLHHY